MKILMCHKYYSFRGGGERYFFDLSRYMEAKGHTVIHFSMREKGHPESLYSRYFMSHVDFNEPKSWAHQIGAGLRAIYSLEAKRRIEALIQETKPEVAFLHDIYHHLSPSILHGMKRFGLPVVQHVTSYSLICPSYRLLALDGICQRCKGHRYYQAPLQRCFRGSFYRSFAACVVMYVHRAMRIYEKNIDIFLCPSRFLREKLVEFGFPRAKLCHLPQALSIDDFHPRYEPGDYIVYFGRLDREKGVSTLLKSMEQLPDLSLLVIGDGSQRQALERQALDKGLGRVRFLGTKQGQELREIARNSSLVVVPSEWYEPFGLVIYEAFALGKPVIGSNLGAIPELIDDGKDGLLFRAGDPHDLAERLRFLLARPQLVQEMGKRARAKVEQQLGPERNYQEIMKIFHSLLTGHDYSSSSEWMSTATKEETAVTNRGGQV